MDWPSLYLDMYSLFSNISNALNTLSIPWQGLVVESRRWFCHISWLHTNVRVSINGLPVQFSAVVRPFFSDYNYLPKLKRCRMRGDNLLDFVTFLWHFNFVFLIVDIISFKEIPVWLCFAVDHLWYCQRRNWSVPLRMLL